MIMSSLIENALHWVMSTCIYNYVDLFKVDRSISLKIKKLEKSFTTVCVNNDEISLNNFQMYQLAECIL